MSAAFDYLTLTLGRGRAAWQTFADQVAGPAAADIRRQGGELTGLFAPQLGFGSNEAAVLVRWPGGAPGSTGSITGAAPVTAWSLDRLSPTARPRDDQALREGGVYVHRWFVVDAGREAEFVDLSTRAWIGFEGAYETEIFGLFTAAATEGDLAAGQGRLLLLTWYASHGVWEASREQTVDPEGLFVRRHELTRSTIGRSSLRVATPT